VNEDPESKAEVFSQVALLRNVLICVFKWLDFDLSDKSEQFLKN
jgi:hypothetical protein